MDNKVLVEVSARHLHVSAADLEVLFGKGHALTAKKDLSQPGQYACAERVDVVGPKRTLAGVSILGPVRPVTQVEISTSPQGPTSLQPALPAMSPDSRMGAFTPMARASVREISTWVTGRTGPRIDTPANILNEYEEDYLCLEKLLH